jgi:mono/diheme cytochrome c family protein
MFVGKIHLRSKDLTYFAAERCLLALAIVFAASSHSDTTGVAARWEFGTEETTPLTAHGGVKRDQTGPIAPEFPDFATDNTAVHLDGQGARLVVPDSGPKSPFDYGNGDAITIEAWVKLESIRDGQPMYVIGKGRTNSPKFPRNNQNWALRVVGKGDQARVGFLFASQKGPGGGQWHRWTSNSGFHVVTGWHHIAVTYQFGKSGSIRGWIDGSPTDGTWDMGGATDAAPVVDDDAVWIGSSLGGNPGNSFHGSLDSILVHRALRDDKYMAARFNRLGGPRVIGPLPESMPNLGEVSPGKLLLTLSEKMPAHERWLNEGEVWPEEIVRWEGGEFLLPRIPLRHDDWGIRTGWKAPTLLRMAADVALEQGNHRFMLRARGLGRLWVDGVVVARTKPLEKQPPNGEESITPLAVPKYPGARVPGYRMQEVYGDVVVKSESDGTVSPSRVVLEVVVGGKSHRTESGEICVAVVKPGGAPYEVLRPAGGNGGVLSLTDVAVEPVLLSIEQVLSKQDDLTRQNAASSRNAFWDARHAKARNWVSENPVPARPVADSAERAHPVDAFVLDKIDRARAASLGEHGEKAALFHTEVLPILRESCFRCHGDKEKGGLRLNSREAALGAGDSEIPAVVPGDLAASELIARVRSADEEFRMPPKGDGLAPEQIAKLETWVQSGAGWPAQPFTEEETKLASKVEDPAFLRRLFLDTVGVPPTEADFAAFQADSSWYKRFDWIDRLLSDDRVAHHWMGEWQDMLAENPTMLNASLNSTGPFRWFLLDALRDNKPIDRMVTELILMRGSPHEGGSAGFALAGENDAPYAAKGHILASALLGVEMQCARCHDAPYHRSTQRDLFSLAAMLERKAVTVPKTSAVPAAFFENMDRKPLIRVTLKPGEEIVPRWPFAALTGAADSDSIDGLMENPKDTRERLAALMTAPGNMRFAQVIVNRVWNRLMGAGIVEPVYDWEGHAPSHPDLLAWLASEFVANGYDLRHLTRLILTSDTYQRQAVGGNRSVAPEGRFFNAPDPRRLTAEQVVDSLHVATGVPMNSDELTFVHDGRRPVSNRLTLGKPTRAWMFASLNNERDRPSLNLPRAQAISDVLEAFGWTGSRQKPITQRETEPNVLQPGVLANGTLSQILTRAAEGSILADIAVESDSPETLVESLFIRVLGRAPSEDEWVEFSNLIASGFEERLLSAEEIVAPVAPEPLPLVTWFNHLRSEANTIQVEYARRVRQGPPPDRRLRPEWRERYEDLVWSLINHREFVWIP